MLVLLGLLLNISAYYTAKNKLLVRLRVQIQVWISTNEISAQLRPLIIKTYLVLNVVNVNKTIAQGLHKINAVDQESEKIQLTYYAYICTAVR